MQAADLAVEVGQARRGAGQAAVTVEGFLGDLFRAIAANVPPPKGLQSPMLWGKEEHLAALFGKRAAKIDVTRKHFVFRYLSAAHFIQIFRDYYGPTHKAFAALDDAGKRKLDADLTAVLEKANTRPGSLVIPAESCSGV